MCDVKMHDAVVKRDVHALREAIDEGADVNASKGPGSNGETPLMIAARQGSLDVCKALVDARADVHLQSGTGWTALDLARALTLTLTFALILAFALTVCLDAYTGQEAFGCGRSRHQGAG